MRLKTYVPSGINTHFCKPFITRLNLPYSVPNNSLFKKIRSHLLHKFDFSLLPSFSTYPNLKMILCKFKLYIFVMFLLFNDFYVYF